MPAAQAQSDVRDAVFRHKGKEGDAQSVGRVLGVRAVLTGSVRLRGEALSVHVELVGVADNSRLWGESYERTRAEVQGVRDAIVQEISAKLQLHLTGDEKSRLNKQHTPDPEAYLLYLQGHYHWGQAGEKELRKALTYFERAIDKDKKYAPAWAGVARSYAKLSGNGYIRPLEAITPAKKAVATALQLDDRDDGVNTVAGVVFLFFDRDRVAAENALQKAMQVKPRSPAVHLYGLCLAARGQLKEAVTLIERDKELNPYSVTVSQALIMAYYSARQYDQAIAEAERLLAMVPGYPVAYETIGLAYSQKGTHDKAISSLEKAVRLPDGSPRFSRPSAMSMRAEGNAPRPKRFLPSCKRFPPTATLPRACRP